MDKLNSTLRDRAIGYGLCQQWQGDWKDDKSKQELIDMYIKGIDFCISNNYPSNEFIEENFEQGLLEDNQIYVNKQFAAKHLRGVTVVCGRSSGSLSFDGVDTGDVYVKDGSSVVINVSGFSRVCVDLYGSANVIINQADIAKVFVYKYSDDSKVVCNGNVVVRNRVGKI